MRFIDCVRLGKLGAPPCCTSCHDDEFNGHGIMERDLEDDLTVYFCCAKLDWVNANANLIREEHYDGKTSLLDS